MPAELSNDTFDFLHAILLFLVSRDQSTQSGSRANPDRIHLPRWIGQSGFDRDSIRIGFARNCSVNTIRSGFGSSVNTALLCFLSLACFLRSLSFSSLALLDSSDSPSFHLRFLSCCCRTFPFNSSSSQFLPTCTAHFCFSLACFFCNLSFTSLLQSFLY